MAIAQIGFLGRTGPIFRDDAPGGGKYILLLGRIATGKIVAKQPAWAGNLNVNGTPLNPADYVTGGYADEQVLGNLPAYTQPAITEYDGYTPISNTWTAGTGTGGNTGTYQGATPTTTTTTTTGGGMATTGGGGMAATGGVDSTVYKTPTLGEQVQTFLSSYWWVLVIAAIVLLWQPVIAPALGLGKKSGKKYR